MANKLNFSEIQAAANTSPEALKQKLDEIIREHDETDPPYLSDILANPIGGQLLQVKLGNDAQSRGGKRFRWIIKALCDEYGRPLKPGDKVSRKVREADQLYSDVEEHTLWTSQQMNASMASGTFEQDFETKLEFELDDRGCFECGFDDAVYFLWCYGTHGKSKRFLNPQRSLGVSTEPELCGEGNTRRHVHYWRYTEVDNEQYEALAPLDIDKSQAVETVEPAPKPRRRRSKKAV